MQHNQLYTYFGCKKKMIDIVWTEYFHDIDMLIEPFAGTAVIACNKPDTVNVKTTYLNDYDCHIANVLRSVVYDSEALIDYICHPRLELDLHMIHDYITGAKPYLRDLLMKNIDAHDVKLAGWWVWGINHWIGGSWCNCELKKIDKLTEQYDEDFFVYPSGVGEKVSTGRNKLISSDQVTHQKISTDRNKLLHGDQLTHNKTSDRYDHVSTIVNNIYDQLSEAKIMYGDFERVITDSYTGDGKRVGIFMDPPYQKVSCATYDNLYGSSNLKEDHNTFDRAKKWFLDNYKNPKLKIILCGHKECFDDIHCDIKKVEWKRGGGYAKDKDGQNSEMFITNIKS